MARLKQTLLPIVTLDTSRYPKSGLCHSVNFLVHPDIALIYHLLTCMPKARSNSLPLNHGFAEPFQSLVVHRASYKGQVVWRANITALCVSHRANDILQPLRELTK